MQKHGEKTHSVASLSGGQGDALTILADEKRAKSDTALVGRAVRLGWPIEQANKDEVVRRLLGIVRKKTIEVPTKEGSIDSAYHADGNAVAAARVLVSMDAQNQADAHLEAKTERLDSNGVTERLEVVFTNQLPSRAED